MDDGRWGAPVVGEFMQSIAPLPRRATTAQRQRRAGCENGRLARMRVAVWQIGVASGAGPIRAAMGANCGDATTVAPNLSMGQIAVVAACATKCWMLVGSCTAALAVVPPHLFVTAARPLNKSVPSGASAIWLSDTPQMVCSTWYEVPPSSLPQMLDPSHCGSTPGCPVKSRRPAYGAVRSWIPRPGPVHVGRNRGRA